MNMGIKNLFLATLILLGSVDRLEGDIVVATLDSKSGDSEVFELPMEMFPCEISEGDMFYFSYSGGVTEIRCGEPDPS